MRILRFDILNNKAISSWVHDANGKDVEIAGETNVGKTTAASSLWELVNKSSDSLKHGEVKGHIILHLGDGKPDLIAKRSFTKKSNTITIQRADGTSVSAKDFKAMISKLAENPHRIADMKPKERIETLLAAADLSGADLDTINKDISAAEESRLSAHRMATDTVPGPQPEKVEPVDVSAINAELEKMRDHNLKIDEISRQKDDVSKQGLLLKESIADSKLALQKKQEEIKADQDRITAEESRLTSLRKDVTDLAQSLKATKRLDLSELQTKLSGATEVNDKVSRFAVWQEKQKSHVKWEVAKTKADSTVLKLREQKKTILKNAKWPLEDFDIEGEDLIYEGILFENLGQSKQMLVCAALVVKDVLAHPLRCVRLDGVESMSAEDYDKLKKLFGENGIQIISTRVARGDVEEGELVISELEKEADNN